MRYQACRWYDPYPRLAFALKLLYFSPLERCEFATQKMSQFLDSYLGENNRPLVNRLGAPISANRWYDRTEETSRLIERMKQSPDSLKTVCADKLMALLTHTAAT